MSSWLSKGSLVIIRTKQIQVSPTWFSTFGKKRTKKKDDGDGEGNAAVSRDVTSLGPATKATVGEITYGATFGYGSGSLPRVTPLFLLAISSSFRAGPILQSRSPQRNGERGCVRKLVPGYRVFLVREGQGHSCERLKPDDSATGGTPPHRTLGKGYVFCHHGRTATAGVHTDSF